MGRLFESNATLPLRACRYFTATLNPLIPGIARPIVAPGAACADRSLLPIFLHAQQYGDSALISESGTLLYRWYESRADYRSARKIVKTLLDGVHENPSTRS